MWNATLKRSIALALVLALFLVTLSACGGESDDGADSPEPVQQPVVSSSTAPAQEPTAASQPAPEPTAAPIVATEPAAMERKLGEVDGVTFIVGEGSEATFTVGEVLARVPLPIEAVMRTEGLSGRFTSTGGSRASPSTFRRWRATRPTGTGGRAAGSSASTLRASSS